MEENRSPPETPTRVEKPSETLRLTEAGIVQLISGVGLCDPIDYGLGEGNGNPLQYSCLENPMDGGAW